MRIKQEYQEPPGLEDAQVYVDIDDCKLSLYNTNCLLFCTEKYKPEVDNADQACEACISRSE